MLSRRQRSKLVFGRRIEAVSVLGNRLVEGNSPGGGIPPHPVGPQDQPPPPHTRGGGDEGLGSVTTSAGEVRIRLRARALEPPDTRSWIVCDGDIDPEWIEPGAGPPPSLPPVHCVAGLFFAKTMGNVN